LACQLQLATGESAKPEGIHHTTRCAFAKARRALQEMRSAAVANGTAAMPTREIDAEILLVRKKCRIGTILSLERELASMQDHKSKP
jgi:hypothetical protein